MPRTATHKNTSSKNQAFSLRKDIDAIRGDTEELASHAYSAVRSAAGGAVEDVTAQRDELVETISDYVSNRPLASIGFAVAAGFILAKIWR